MGIWIAQSTTFFGGDALGFKSKKSGIEYVEKNIKRWTDKVVKTDCVIWVEWSNGEDVYLTKVKMLSKKRNCD